MKYRLLLLLLVLTGSQFLSAQQVLRPFVAHYGDNLVCDNFPAISEDGLHYLIIYSQYSCCVDLGFSLQKIRSSDGKLLDEIILSPSEEADEFMVAKQKSIYEKVKKLLESDNYYTLKEILKFDQKVDPIDNKMYVEVNVSNEVCKSEKFILPQVNSHGFCCNGGTDIHENCLLYQSIVNVSLSVEHKMFLIETGLAQVADGCDQGPFYRMIPITKN
ncbi:hypothetical protein D1818_01525 [Aquimarina sp. BL5]|uniref:hypothetical protein n=2 Tax=Aquimarina sp. BL5 TaxID=1714860 RepID=UPI000E4EF701|nr:hypothetical protein [Aquimarina sp. BL5]AXT49562.1 hypothetical protein D1818_01525 [Aquimarina sp. BL5]